MWQRNALIIGRRLGWIMLPALIAAFVWWRRDVLSIVVSGEPPKDISEIVKNYAQALVWLAGGIFFAYKTFSGRDIASLSLAVVANRSPIPNSDDDYMAVSLTITNGDKATIRLHDAQVRIITEEGHAEFIEFSDLRRTDHVLQPFETTKRGVVCWEQLNPREPLLNIAAKETTQLTNYRRVRALSAYRVEAVVIGMRRAGLQMGQWRASCFCPPRAAPSERQVRRGFVSDVLSWFASSP